MSIAGALAGASYGASVVPGQTIDADTRWTLAESPYRVTGTVRVGEAATLTIEPGVTVQFQPFSSLQIQGNLVAEGTAEARIAFEGTENQPGSWDGLSVSGRRDARASASISHVTVSGGGRSGRAAIYAAQSDVWLSSAIVRGSTGHGVWTQADAAVHVTDATFEANAGHALFLDPARESQLRRLQAAGNGVDAIGIGIGDVEGRQVWEAAGLPYFVEANIVVPLEAALAVEPGVEVRFAERTSLSVRGALEAAGTLDRPITFAGLLEEPGSWGGITVSGTREQPAQLLLDQVTVAHGGRPAEWNLRVGHARATIANSSIVDGGGDGIRFEGGQDGSYVTRSQIVGNAGYGLRNDGRGDDWVAAPLNWWGAADGPSTDDGCLSGAGSTVFGPVAVDPFLRAPDDEPDLLAPSPMRSLEIRPERWVVPADGQTRLWFTVTLRDGAGRPLAGKGVRVAATRGTVQAAPVTDVSGLVRGFATSQEPGEAEISVRHDEGCSRAVTAATDVAFTDAPDGLLSGAAPYFTDRIQVDPLPVVRGVPTTISATMANPGDQDLEVELEFGLSTYGIGLAFGPIGREVGIVPAGGEATFSVEWTPVVAEVHYCIEVLYRVTAVIDADGRRGGVFPAQSGAGRQQYNVQPQPGPMGPSLPEFGSGPDPGPPKKKPLEDAERGMNAVNFVGSLAGGETAVPGAAVGGWWGQIKKHATSIVRSLGGDPPRQDYTLIAEPDRPTTAGLEPVAGVSADRAAAEHALAEALAEFAAVGRPVLVSLDRYGGAAAAGDVHWASYQASALLHYRKLAGEAALPVADGLAQLRSVIEREEAELAVDAATVRAYLERLAREGYSAQELAAAAALGITEEELELMLATDLETDPDAIAGRYVDALTEAEQAWRQLAPYLGAAVNFPDEPGREGAAGIALASTHDNRLARIFDAHATFELRNPLAETAHVELRVRPIDLPAGWAVQLEGAPSEMAAGEQVTVGVLIRPTRAAVQATAPRVAIEAYANGQLLGGVVLDVVVPQSVPFTLEPPAAPPEVLVPVEPEPSPTPAQPAPTATPAAPDATPTPGLDPTPPPAGPPADTDATGLALAVAGVLVVLLLLASALFIARRRSRRPE